MSSATRQFVRGRNASGLLKHFCPSHLEKTRQTGQLRLVEYAQGRRLLVEIKRVYLMQYASVFKRKDGWYLHAQSQSNGALIADPPFLKLPLDASCESLGQGVMTA